MREIKFRGKRIDNGEWVYGSLLISEHQEKNLEPLHYFICPLDKGYHRVIPETVGQFTGLKDKNGKEIYEGDIIQLINEDLEEIKVICEFGTAKIFDNLVEIKGFYFKRLDDDRKTFPIINNYLGKHDLELFEVIGNIHDNTELLESDNK